MSVLIQNALIVNGDGVTPPFVGDVLIERDRLRFVGEVPASAIKTAGQVIDAAGLALAPGFVDTHNHGALGGTALQLSGFPMACEMSVLGGVTKRICGVDGLSPAPVLPEQRAEYAAQLAPLDGAILGEFVWSDMAGYYRWHEGRSVTDQGMYLGHGAVRRMIMGNAPRASTVEELRAMAAVVKREAMSVLGFSTGLVYNPAVYCEQAEITALVRAFTSVRKGALFPHLRSESDCIEASLDECLEAAIEGGAGYCNEHTKIAGERNWDRVDAVEGRLKDAAGSTPVMENMYPYTAGSTTGDAIFPPDIRAGERGDFLARLADPVVRRRVWERVWSDTTTWDNFIDFCGGLGGIQIAGVKLLADQRFLGLCLDDVARVAGHVDMLSLGAFEAVCDLFVRNQAEISIISYHGHQPLVERFFRRDTMALCTDGLMPGPGQKPHPRVLGSFPRALRMARELGVSLQRIIYRMATLPCDFLGLESPILRPGADASLVLFDSQTARERNSYVEPLIRSQGIDSVWIHGVRVLGDARLIPPTLFPGRTLLPAAGSAVHA